MASQGLIPFCNIYSSFAQRAYDNVIHDVAIQKLPVVLCLDRAGLVGEDGPTHHGVFDLPSLRCIPNLIISSPIDEHELRNLMYTAQLKPQGPFVIRYPRGNGFLTNWRNRMEEVPIGKGACLREGKDIALLCIGPVGKTAEKVAADLQLEGVSVAVYNMRFVKPLDTALLHTIGQAFDKVVTIENGALIGGFGTAILEFFCEQGYTSTVKRLGIPDQFIEHGALADLHALCGIDAIGIRQTVLDFLNH